jgi:1-acyl-sn-glycerol-3-phosphate acyltransferase
MSPVLRVKYLVYDFLRRIVRAVLPLCMKVRIRGSRYIPQKQPFIIVSNHRFDLDAFLIVYAVQAPITWVAADFLNHFFLTNFIVWLFGMITVSKGKKRDNNFLNLGKIVACLKDGGNIGVFPEGMDYLIAADFNKPMATFYPGYAKIACMLNIPVYPVTIFPQKELARPYPIPKSIRKLFHVSTDLQELPVRNTYRSVTIFFNPPITPNKELKKEHRVLDLNSRVRASIEKNLPYKDA